MELTLDQALHQGIEAHKAGKVLEADRYYTAILKAQPKHSDANHNMGVLAVDFGKVETSLQFFKTAIEANPAVAQYWISYLNTLIKLGRKDDAKNILDQAMRQGVKSESFYQIEKKLDSLEKNTDANTISEKSSEPSQDQLEPLINLYTQGNYQSALVQALQLLNQFPKSVTLYNIIGAANKGLGKLDEAIEAYNEAVSINPDYAGAYYNMGNALKDQGKLDKAVDAFSKALSVKSDYAEASNNMGLVFEKQGKLDEAIESYSKALSINPNYAGAYYNMGNALKGQGKLDKAVEAFSKALSVKSDYAEAHNSIGLVFQKQGKLNEAIEAFAKASSIKPDYSVAYNNIGNVLRDMGKLDEAIEAFTKALSITPDYAKAYTNMGNALKDQGKTDEAIEAYTKALSITPDNPETTTNLAIVLFESTRFEEAAKLFSKNDSIYNQSYLLKCFYELDIKSKVSKQLDYLIKRGENNCVIGSYACRSAIRYGTNPENPFCNEPLKHVKKIDLTKKCDFKKIFIENAASVLSDGEVSHKSQGHLKNGIQTSGNIFTQVGSVTNLWQDVIRAELKNYKDHFDDSTEGLIRDWPSDFSLYGWLVSMKNGGELSAHIHDTGWITGSIYINVPPKLKNDSGNLVVATHDPKYEKGSVKDIKSIDVVTGSLCLFPSSLLHYTIPFESNEDRIVLAFDVIPN